MTRSPPSLPLRALLALGLLGLLGAPLAAAAVPGAAESSDSIFSDKVHIQGKEYDVADPDGDPNESDTVEQDSTAQWQREMIAGLINQRKEEKNFMDRLEIGGKTLEEMVLNITAAFKEMEKARQQKGRQLIKEHFQSEINLLKQSQQDVVASLSTLLIIQPTDSTDLKSLKQQVSSIITTKFEKQIADQSNLFKTQLEQIEEEHKKQTAHVRGLFDLIKTWKNTFRDGLKTAAAKLEQISEQWDML